MCTLRLQYILNVEKYCTYTEQKYYSKCVLKRILSILNINLLQNRIE